MKLLVVLAFVAVVAAAPEIDYSRYENLDVDKFISNTRLFKGYTACIEGVGKCTAQGKELKDSLPDNLRSGCVDCPEFFKILIAKIVTAVRKQYPEDYDVINKKYNPTGEYDEIVKEFLEKYKS